MDVFNQFPNTRARFTADGQTAYFITATATGDNNTSRSFVYSLNAEQRRSAVPFTHILQPTAHSYSAHSGRVYCYSDCHCHTRGQCYPNGDANADGNSDSDGCSNFNSDTGSHSNPDAASDVQDH